MSLIWRIEHTRLHPSKGTEAVGGTSISKGKIKIACMLQMKNVVSVMSFLPADLFAVFQRHVKPFSV